MSKRFVFFMQMVIGYLLCELSRFVTLNYLIGSKYLLSGLAIMGPMTGVSTGSFVGLVVLFLRRLCMVVLTGRGGFTLLGYHIPLLFASAYWLTPGKSIRVFVPLACIVAFLCHPIGQQAPLYTLFWVLPLLAYFFFNTTIIGQAIGSSFVAHAVGSVLWIYSLPTTPAYWYALIPVVIVERCVCIASMVLLYTLMQYVTKKVQQYMQPRTTTKIVEINNLVVMK